MFLELDFPANFPLATRLLRTSLKSQWVFLPVCICSHSVTAEIPISDHDEKSHPRNLKTRIFDMNEKLSFEFVENLLVAKLASGGRLGFLEYACKVVVITPTDRIGSEGIRERERLLGEGTHSEQGRRRHGIPTDASDFLGG